MMEYLINLDWAILNWIHSALSCGTLDFLMPKLTLLGNGGAVWIAAGIALLCFKKYRRYGSILFCGLIAGLLVGNLILKIWVARPRPCWLNPTVVLLLASPSDFSFPSGHALSSAIAATILTLTDRRFGYVAIPLALLIAFSRLYLYVHFPSDVLSGLLLGVIIGVAVFKIAKQIKPSQARNSG